jgi:hypothetical protein
MRDKIKTGQAFTVCPVLVEVDGIKTIFLEQTLLYFLSP